MAVTPNSAVVAQTPKNGWANFVQGTDAVATYKTVYVAGVNGSKIAGVIGVTTDGTAHVASLRIANVTAGTTTLLAPIVSATIGVNAGNAAGSLDVSLMTSTVAPGLPVDQNGNPFLALVSGDTLQGAYATSLGASGVLSIIATAVSDF